jgi:serine/threonine-protein kinase
MDKIGRYEIEEELGRGAMGVVLRARDPAIGRLVAIKIIRLTEFADLQERQQLRDRLFREAQSAGILSHPGIVTIYDIGEENEITYITMEYVNGPTLEKLLSEGPAPEPDTVFDWLRQAAAALDYAHRKGIVHRDIKPANIMLHDDGKVKVTDFGIAKLSTAQATQTGVALGTPFYMSPEQIRGQDIGGRADQFSLAVIAYEILTGGKPFHADTLPTLFFQIISEQPPPPQRINPSLGPQVDNVFRKALAKEAGSRYATCTEFVSALETACNAKPGWAPLAHGAAESMPTVVTAVEPAPARPALPQVPRPVRAEGPNPNGIFGRMIAILLALVVVGALLVYAPKWYRAWQQEQAPPQPQASAPEPAKTEASAAKPSPEPGSAIAPSAAATTSTAPPTTTPAAGAGETAAPAEKPPVAEPAPPPEPEPQPSPPVVKKRPKPAVAVPAAPKVLLPTIQEVLVTSAPPNAAVTFDKGSTSCQTPCTVQLPSGRHTLAAVLPGYHQELRIFQVGDQTQAVTLDMRRMEGVLSVESTPAGAAIFINGQKRPESTPAHISLPVGRYSLIVTKDGFKRSEQEFEVGDGRFVKITFTLFPLR